MRTWNNQRVVIVGAARQGVALARFLVSRGAHVILNDQRPAGELLTSRQALADETEVEWVCGGHPFSLLDGIDWLCPSGGVPLSIPLVQEALDRGVPLSNDSQIFLEEAPCQVVGITGSSGKTTTTSLVGRIAQAAIADPSSKVNYNKIWVGGNIGSPLLAYIDQMQPDDLAIMELSSFQLEIMTISPQIAAVLNVTPNHLDRHGSMEDYLSAKANIIKYQSINDALIFGREDPGAKSLAAKAKGRASSFGLSELAADQSGTFYKNNSIYLQQAEHPALPESVVTRDQIALRGEHNLFNVLAACAISAVAGMPVQAMRQGIEGFPGVPHRLEFVRTWNGANWYNDSIATAPERAIAAIRSFDEPLVLLSGGRDKKLPWDDFATLVRRRVDHLILFGEAAPIIVDALALTGEEKLTVKRCDGLKEAVHAAAQVAGQGDVVLLAPGGTSFDEFKDFEERGECFAQLVRELV